MELSSVLYVGAELVGEHLAGKGKQFFGKGEEGEGKEARKEGGHLGDGKTLRRLPLSGLLMAEARLRREMEELPAGCLLTPSVNPPTAGRSGNSITAARK